MMPLPFELERIGPPPTCSPRLCTNWTKENEMGRCFEILVVIDTKESLESGSGTLWSVWI